MVKTGIRRKNIYRMDEGGFPSTDQGKTHVVAARGTKSQHKQGGTAHENTTALVTICADGTSLHSTIVFKGKGFKEVWFKDNVLKAS
jgi:cytidine deaminase